MPTIEQQYKELVGLQQLALRDLRDSMSKFILPTEYYATCIGRYLKDFEAKREAIEKMDRVEDL